MKFIIYICFMLVGNCYAQVAFQNFGNVQMHENAEVGFHIDLVNDGTFNENLGIAGFYSEDYSLSISGTEIPRFHDMEVDVVNHLFLDINTEIVNSVSYIVGDVITPRDTPNVSLDYLTDSFYVMEDDERNTDGYASYQGDLTFSFPIGDRDKLRPLITTNTIPNTTVKAAYFDEDPNMPSTFTTSFNTNSLESIVGVVSNLEFWDFNGPDNSVVTLTWDSESEIDNLAEDLRALRVVGWHIQDKEWKDLGNSGFSGTISEGTINSFVFNPSEYEILTFGALITEDDIDIANLVSPNGDGINEVFYIEGIEAFDNELIIFNRWGSVVYQVDNYKNNWSGLANVNNVIKRHKKVPTGTYYYVLKLKESNKSSAGWLYITY
ncbi:gliding motility-associated C-terminal domain-containing protein [uncultured Algibacter sp.]|uniref:gliding motility-associated C-terminal domain-containing protein n=1 Tax=uncultured Algibacter sp. TaxID=298659 RepID=UPI0026076009|nr:gliding motility-associated C-terminal domain-containing protein [uncultured Algibacter sp.]